MKIKEFFDPNTSTISYVVFDPITKDTVIIDPVLDYESSSSSISIESLEKVSFFIKENNLTPLYIMETHAHADHLSSSQILKKRFPGLKVAIGQHIRKVQKTFKKVFNLPDFIPSDGSQFDVLLKEGEIFNAGSLPFEIFHTPGHTPACSTYKIGDFIFTGDALFMPDSGTGRCDFPDGSAEELYHSVHEVIYKFADSVKVLVCHDYQPGGRQVKFMSTIAEEKKSNVHLNWNTTKQEFVDFRTKRDKTLSAPKLLFQSVQVNIDAGKLPKNEGNCIRYFKIPINVFKSDSLESIILEGIDD